ncbi:uncharacterized protein [Miscanthus floridulus]|uniref:uncharacterized protein n=1 Tax=Miscanthus floridulus TaxID=154761 RepID=UPI00345934D7
MCTLWRRSWTTEGSSSRKRSVRARSRASSPTSSAPPPNRGGLTLTPVSCPHRPPTSYAHCEKRILVVLHCSEGTYDMVKLPTDEAELHVSSGLPVDSIFARTNDRVLLRYASVDAFRVKVWALQESADGGGQLEWTLTHDKDLAVHARMRDLLHHAPSNCVPLSTGEGRGGGRGKSVWFSDEDTEEVGSGDVGDGCSAS